MKHAVWLAGVCLATLALNGCGDGRTTDTKPVPFGDPGKKNTREPGEKARAPKQIDMTGRVKVGEYSVAFPAGWENEKPMSEMRLLQAKLPKVPGDEQDALLTVFSLGGSVQENFDRWEKQFTNPEVKKQELRTTGNDPATIIEIQGTFAGMGPKGESMPAQENQKMLGGIIVVGMAQFQFKLTGPVNTINANKDAFVKMIESFQ
jgi:hypothetical protein